ncbi:MAG TPA: PQQ-dependent sugar dehydrogenase [Terriglobia bacterium]|nr:PQQ-dependent sugar dehydrogenase [Terriglobia bacterium]
MKTLRKRGYLCGVTFMALTMAISFCWSAIVRASGPVVFDTNLSVRTVVSGLVQPTSMAFLNTDDFLVLEKASGKVQRVLHGVVQPAPALDLAVNSGSERGLLGIALHPDFPRNPGVYLYWTESTATDANGNRIDSTLLTATPLLGNRVDRFVWNGSTLTFERNLIMLHAFQADAGQPLRGNHNGGVIVFERRERDEEDDNDKDEDEDQDKGKDNRRDVKGENDEDEKARLFIIIGDNGRRGQLQNLLNGPFGPGIPDDQFGGPRPDNAHLTGVILRLNDDGTTPRANPFFKFGAQLGGEVGANIQKIYAYGIRNSFGLAVDPHTGNLWNEENGDDSFDEINRITAGQNNGWVQVMGPISRVAQFKAIETDTAPHPPFAPAGYFGLQQIRWPPTNIAGTPAEAASRLVMLPGAHYSDPEFSWKFAIAPAAIGFLDSRALGREYEGDLFVGASRPSLDDGYLLRFKLKGDRRSLSFSDPRLADRVADNSSKFDPTESETLRFGAGFGVATDIQTGPNGNLFVVSLSDGQVYEISRK